MFLHRKISDDSNHNCLMFDEFFYNETDCDMVDGNTAANLASNADILIRKRILEG